MTSVNFLLLDYISDVKGRWPVPVDFFRHPVFNRANLLCRLLGANIIFADKEHDVLNVPERMIQH